MNSLLASQFGSTVLSNVLYDSIIEPYARNWTDNIESFNDEALLKSKSGKLTINIYVGDPLIDGEYTGKCKPESKNITLVKFDGIPLRMILITDGLLKQQFTDAGFGDLYPSPSFAIDVKPDPSTHRVDNMTRTLLRLANAPFPPPNSRVSCIHHIHSSDLKFIRDLTIL